MRVRAKPLLYMHALPAIPKASRAFTTTTVVTGHEAARVRTCFCAQHGCFQDRPHLHHYHPWVEISSPGKRFVPRISIMAKRWVGWEAIRRGSRLGLVRGHTAADPEGKARIVEVSNEDGYGRGSTEVPGTPAVGEGHGSGVWWLREFGNGKTDIAGLVLSTVLLLVTAATPIG